MKCKQPSYSEIDKGQFHVADPLPERLFLIDSHSK
jgi:hypothetical protein